MSESGDPSKPSVPRRGCTQRPRHRGVSLARPSAGGYQMWPWPKVAAAVPGRETLGAPWARTTSVDLREREVYPAASIGDEHLLWFPTPTAAYNAAAPIAGEGLVQQMESLCGQPRELTAQCSRISTDGGAALYHRRTHRQGTGSSQTFSVPYGIISL
ncbi:unnamed protein product [Prorocentrum cordatum]|uniref:Uncharacterized protein n=1 Tax=Prorocentrum cordatum TaxID=2364126 RepID=A0ABN9PPZ4_9DINO|nr:unnamed protein product [Polarella glacialis]